jgi:hypothetical protein
MPIPSDSTHLSAQATSEMIEEYAGAVDSQFAKSSIMRGFVNIDNLQGTDTKIKRRVGRTVLKKVVAGVRPDAAPTSFGRTAVTVDTISLARDNRDLLNEFQTDFNARQQLGMDHGKELGKLFDQAHIIAAIKGAAAAAPTDADGTNYNGAFGAGSTTTMAASNDDLDPTKFYEAIAAQITAMEEEDIDIEECVVFVRPTYQDVLLNNDKLLNRDFSSDNGDFANGTFRTLKGVPIVSTTRIPTAAITGHVMSDAKNSNFYDVTAAEARSKAIIMHPKALFAAETIPLTSKVYYDDKELQWFIDSYLAFGVNYDRPDCARVVRSFD